jgi:hypothetical protein
MWVLWEIHPKECVEPSSLEPRLDVLDLLDRRPAEVLSAGSHLPNLEAERLLFWRVKTRARMPIRILHWRAANAWRL